MANTVGGFSNMRGNQILVTEKSTKKKVEGLANGDMVKRIGVTDIGIGGNFAGKVINNTVNMTGRVCSVFDREFCEEYGQPKICFVNFPEFFGSYMGTMPVAPQDLELVNDDGIKEAYIEAYRKFLNC